MKKRLTRSAVAAAALTASFALPGLAAARPAPRVHVTRPSIDQEIVEQGSNGFEIKIGVRDRRRLTLTATKVGSELSFQTVTYSMPVRPSPDPTEIRASFGGRGRVDMRFEPEKVKRLPHSRACEGNRAVLEEGFWSGFLGFHGEQGFTEVRVRGALGSVVRRSALRCPARKTDPAKLKRQLRQLEREREEREAEAEDEGEKGVRGIRLEVASKDRGVALVAQRIAIAGDRKKTSLSSLVAIATRHRGRVKEVGGVLGGLTPGSYIRPADSGDPLAEFVVEPGGAFSGSATYRTRRGGKPTWSGDLKVEIPGFGAVGLAGKDTRAVACESLFLECEDGLGGGASELLKRRTAAWRSRR